MAFLIDQLNNSGLFAQSAYSAGIATCDSDGNIITATYLTGVDLTPYQTTADMINYQTVSGMTAYATTGDVENKLDTTSFSDVSGTFLTAHQSLDGYATTAWVDSQGYLTAHQPISADEWNNVYDTVNVYSGAWTGSESSPTASVDSNGSIDIVSSNNTVYFDVNGTWFNNAVNSALPTSSVQWNSNYDTVNTNSGVWGGSALPISAGPGIKVDLVDNTLVFRNDETVLWEGTAFSPADSTNPMRASASMSESIQNFDQIRLDFRGSNYIFNESVLLTHPYNTNKNCYFNVKKEQSNNSTYIGTLYKWVNDTTLSGMCSYGNTQNVTAMSGGYYGYGSVVRVIGINRINNA